jgi:hypothetical protein
MGQIIGFREFLLHLNHTTIVGIILWAIFASITPPVNSMIALASLVLILYGTIEAIEKIHVTPKAKPRVKR